MFKKVIGIVLAVFIVVLLMYSRIVHNQNIEQNIKNLSYQELEKELIKLEDKYHEYKRKQSKISEKEKKEMERKFTIIMQELEERDQKERDQKKAEELIKLYDSKKTEVDLRNLGTGYYDVNQEKWIDTTSKPAQPNDDGGNSLNDSEPR